MRHRFMAGALLAVLPLPAIAATVIDGATIVDTRTGHLMPNRAILIDGGKIVRIAGAGSIHAENRVDARGKFIVPGFLDMHAHPLNSPSPETSLPLMVANGITGYRQMSGSDELLAARKAGTLPAPVPAPELLALPGQVLAGPLAGNPQAAAAEATRQAAAGADFIKIVDLAPPAFAAVARAATAAGKPFVGHLPATIDVHDAAGLGMRSIEHLGGGLTLLEACSRDYPALLAAHRAMPPRKLDFSMPPAQLKRLISNPSLLTDPETAKLLRRALDTYDEPTCRAVAKRLAARGVWQAPTLIRLKTSYLGDAKEFSDNAALRYAAPEDRALWRDVGVLFTQRIDPERRALFAALWARSLKMVKLFDEEHVPMLAGTDFGGQWVVAGFSLHQEFDLLAEAGIKPLRILQMTTIDGARFLGREATMGRVEPGKDANLVLLDANPVTSAANLHRIAGVMRGGVWYSRAALDAIERAVAQP